MTLTIGRCVLDDSPDGGSIRVAGDRLSFRCDITATSVYECLARIQQLSGLVNNPDEEVFPFVWSEDPRFDGFYRVRSVDVTPSALFLSTGYASFSIELERVAGGYGRPLFETIATRVLRPNDHAVTTPVGVKYAAPEESDSSIVFSSSLTTADGVLRYKTAAWAAETYAWTSYCPAAHYYDQSARFEITVDPDTQPYFPVVGRQIPVSMLTTDPGAGGWGLWRLTNGWTSVYPIVIPDSGGVERFGIIVAGQQDDVVPRFLGCGSSVASLVDMTGDADGGFWAPILLVNSPELVVVRLTSHAGYTWDYSLRLGDTRVDVALATSSSGSYTAGIQVFGSGGTGIASTSFTGGVRATAGVARYAIACAKTPAAGYPNVTQGATGYSSSTGHQFAVTDNYLAGVSTTTAGLLEAFLAYRSERRRVVAR
ncbi:MAG: hypothetical protein Q7V57_11290 [Actinomycetota bacterium]|nr:hypothetical protein [Actinomycetota bacterium]